MPVIDEAIAIADGLRRLYGIDTGDVLADRTAAGHRAAAYLEGLAFTPEAIRTAAQELGYSLDPAACRTACRDTRALAETELRKRALRTLLRPPPDPGAAGPCP